MYPVLDKHVYHHLLGEDMESELVPSASIEIREQKNIRVVATFWTCHRNGRHTRHVIFPTSLYKIRVIIRGDIGSTDVSIAILVFTSEQ